MVGLTVARDVLLLIALGIGYLVLYFANREEKGLRLIGYFIGSLILTLTVAYMVGDFILQTKILNARISRAKRMLMQQQAGPMMQRQGK